MDQDKKLGFGKKKILLAGPLFLILFLSPFIVSANESCFVEFNFNETLIEPNWEFFDTNLDYLGLRNLYGNYNNRVNRYHPDFSQTYRLDVYDSSGFFEEYSFETGLFLLDAEVDILNESQTSVVIPYNEDIEKIRVFLDYDLKLEVHPEGIKCERDCLIEEEIGKWQDDECCDEFLKVGTDNASEMTCVDCGDSYCSSYETGYNCPEDCDMTEEITLQDVLNAVNSWANNEIELSSVLSTIQQWSSS